MAANNDPIGKALGLTPLNPVKDLMNKANDSSAKSDFEIARTNLHEIINTGLDSLDKLSMIAEQSQHPRAFEVIAKLIDSIATASKDLMELQKSVREIEDIEGPSKGPSSVTNNLFVGSTAELQKVLKQIKDE